MQEIERLVRFSTLLLIFNVLSVNLIFCQEFPDNRVDSLLKSGIRFIINQDYFSADLSFKQLDTEYPELPLGKIYLAVSKIAESFDYAEEYDTKYIESYLEAAQEHTNQLLLKDENSLWYIYFSALAEGYTAYFEALKKNWITSFSKGWSSISAFEECLTIDNNFYESYIALGTFEYWKSRKTEFLTWMPFYDNDIETGIENLKTAVKHSSYNHYLAINSLMWIYVDQKEFNKAIELGETALEEFPDSRYFKRGLARAYEDVDPNRSIDLYNDILDSYPSDRKQNRINFIRFNHKIAQQYAQLGEKEKAIFYCDQILAINNLSEFELSKLSRRIERVQELKNSLIK